MLSRTTPTALFLTALLTSGAVRAQSDDERNQLLSLLDQQTRIATKTRLNADYVPGILTVLQGDDLAQRGIRSVWEALELVPDFTVTTEPTGSKQLIVRGIGQAFASGNVKILLNGVAMNSATQGLAEPVLNIAIEQVKRIEVIRGPGSAIHGEYAYAGVINVITRTQGQRIFARRESFNTWGGGAVAAGHSANGNWHADLNVATRHSNGAASRVQSDALYRDSKDLAQYSYAPGPANEARRDSTGILRIGYKDFTLLGQWTESAFGDHFGINETLPPPDRRLVETHGSGSIELRQRIVLDSTNLRLYIGRAKSGTKKDGLYAFPAAHSDPNYALPDLPIQVDLEREERRDYGGVTASWKPTAANTTLIGFEARQIRVTNSGLSTNSYFDASYNPIPSTQVYQYPGYPEKGTSRNVTSAILQDEYRATASFTLTTGLRYDDYSDIGSNTAPRIAGVWRVNDHHILKAQYARAYRPPTLYELSASQRIEPSTVDTAELGYIYKGDRHEARATVFESHLDNLVIFPSATASFDNAAHAQFAGIELEYAGNITPTLELDGNVSAVHARDDASGQAIAGAPGWTANLGLKYRPLPDLMVALQHKAVGPFQREAVDPRSDASGYGVTDVTLSDEHFVWRGLVLRAGLKNAFDSDVRYPAPLTTDSTQRVIVGYPDDLPQPGRQWWLEIVYKL